MSCCQRQSVRGERGSHALTSSSQSQYRETHRGLSSECFFGFGSVLVTFPRCELCPNMLMTPLLMEGYSGVSAGPLWSVWPSGSQWGHGPLHQTLATARPCQTNYWRIFIKNCIKAGGRELFRQFCGGFRENLMQATFPGIKLKTQSRHFSCFKDCRFGFMNNAPSYSTTKLNRFLSLDEKCFLS